jgi:predicted 3-demethylubiquinone-9 3-methyltransferase (glyoxalase superfamily)
MEKITPFLWFDSNAEEAANYYVSLFKNSKILGMSRYGDSGPGPKGSVLTVQFQLEGKEFTALNGGPTFKFTEAISLVVKCKDQEEIDTFWEKLSAGGEKSQCGWLKDKYGLSWQIVPAELSDMLMDQDVQRTDRVMKEILTMTKLDLARMKQAYEAVGTTR